MKKVAILIALLLLFFVLYNFSILFSLNYFDGISNSDEYLIKKFRSHHNYSRKELKQLEIECLAELDGYKIYFVDNKDLPISDGWVKDEFQYPPESHVRIVGVKNGELYTLEKLVEESPIFTKGLYKLIQEYSASKL